MIDDQALRHEATKLLQAIRQERPAVAMAVHVLDRSPACALIVEIRITATGTSGCLVALDHPAHREQQVLWMSAAEPASG